VSKDSVAKVKAIFQNLRVKELFEAHEDETHARIALVVASEVPATLRPIYNWHLGKIFKRSK